MKMVVNAIDPANLNNILELLDEMEYLEIQGMNYDIIPGSMEFGGKYKST